MEIYEFRKDEISVTLRHKFQKGCFYDDCVPFQMEGQVQAILVKMEPPGHRSQTNKNKVGNTFPSEYFHHFTNLSKPVKKSENLCKRCRSLKMKVGDESSEEILVKVTSRECKGKAKADGR